MAKEYETMQPSLTEDELTLLSQMDPNFKQYSAIKDSINDNARFKAYMADKPDAYELSNPVDGFDIGANAGEPSVDDYLSKKAKKLEGGFIMEALPIITSIGMPFVQMAIDAIKRGIAKNKLKKKALYGNKGRGIYAPNSHRGFGVSGPKGGSVKEIFNRFAQKRMPKLKIVEEKLKNLNGKSFYNTLTGFVKKTVNKIAPKIGEFGAALPKITDMIVDKMIPNSFQKITSMTKKDGKGPIGDKIKGTISSLGKPMIKWVISKLMDTKVGQKGANMVDNIYKRVKKSNDFLQQAAKYDGKYGTGRIITSKNMRKPKKISTWQKIKKFTGNVLSKTLPNILSEGSKYISPAIDSILGKWGLSDGNSFVSDTVKSLGKSLAITVKQGAEDYKARKAEIEEEKGRMLTAKEKSKLKKKISKNTTEEVKYLKKNFDKTKRKQDRYDRNNQYEEDEDEEYDDEEDDVDIDDEYDEEDDYEEPIKKPIKKPIKNPNTGIDMSKLSQAEKESLFSRGVFGIGKYRGRGKVNFTVKML